MVGLTQGHQILELSSADAATGASPACPAAGRVPIAMAGTAAFDFLKAPKPGTGEVMQRAILQGCDKLDQLEKERDEECPALRELTSLT